MSADNAMLVGAGLAGLAMLMAGVIGGVFFAFSAFVMRALGESEVPSASGIAAMQAVNRTAVRPPLMLVLFGGVVVGLAACILLAVGDAGHGLWWAVGGEAVYLVGVVGMTAGFHVPRNNALAALDATAPDAPTAWRRYQREWTSGNHVRTAAGVVAAALFGVAAALAAAPVLA